MTHSNTTPFILEFITVSQAGKVYQSGTVNLHDGNQYDWWQRFQKWAIDQEFMILTWKLGAHLPAFDFRDHLDI